MENVINQMIFLSGLDPASPNFYFAKNAFRLDPNDARYVDVIHTDSTFRIFLNLGHIDFFVNGGFRQPGCDFDTFGKCVPNYNRGIQREIVCTGLRKQF